MLIEFNKDEIKSDKIYEDKLKEIELSFNHIEK